VVAGGLDEFRLAARGVDVVDDDPGQRGEEGEALVAVARLGDDEQRRRGAVGADQGGERRGGLPGEQQRDEDKGPLGQVDVPDRGQRHGAARGEGLGAGERRQGAHATRP
jgi:hypothetical protein